MLFFTLLSPLMGVAFAMALTFGLHMTTVDRDIEVTMTLGSCYLCFWCAEEAGLSGILAVVIMSLFFKLTGMPQGRWQGRVDRGTAGSWYAK